MLGYNKLQKDDNHIKFTHYNNFLKFHFYKIKVINSIENGNIQ